MLRSVVPGEDNFSLDAINRSFITALGYFRTRFHSDRNVSVFFKIVKK